MKSITAEHVEALSGVYLSPRYDAPQPTPDFHRECWNRYCEPYAQSATAAPRNHAKSTALTHDFILANVLFEVEVYVILVSSSEELAMEHLGDISNELEENDSLRAHFKIKGFLKQTGSDIIVERFDGSAFRILARGAEQKIRGRKWNGKRPGLIICDDLEDDEQVENKDRRKKFRKWFFRACKQALRDGGRIRVHGTVLHVDSLLAHLLKNSSWRSKCYKAHHSFKDFSQILWPEKFPESRLRDIRQEFINEGDSAGYSQEYLNDPIDNDDAYLRSEWFRPMAEEDHDKFKLHFVGVDFALSKQDHANRTSFTVGGKDIENLTHIVDNRSGRMDSLEIVEKFFSVQARWRPDTFYVENGKEWLAIRPILNKEMIARNVFMNFSELTPVKDKKVRGRAFQKRMKAGACRFDTLGSWFAEYKEILLLFTGDAEAMQDDEFDSTATLFMGLELESELAVGDEATEEEHEFERRSQELRRGGDGRSQITGY